MIGNKCICFMAGAVAVLVGSSGPIAGTAKAAAIPGLYDTGVDSTGKVLHDGNLEQHYVLVSQPGSYQVNVIRNNHGWPLPGAWVYGTSKAAWISPGDAQDVLPGTYDYRLTFDLTGFDPGTARIACKWAADNSGEILLNGKDTGQGSQGFGQFTKCRINKGFIAGLNTLDFIVTNDPGGDDDPSGMIVKIRGTANSAPCRCRTRRPYAGDQGG